MARLNFLNDEPWDEIHDDLKFRARWFGHPLGADMLGASLRELLPGSSGGWLHMHYGVEEMFFVLSGTPTFRTGEGEEQLSPGDVVYSEALPGRRRLSGAGDRVGGARCRRAATRGSSLASSCRAKSESAEC